jgi:hypothetical protein
MPAVTDRRPCGATPRPGLARLRQERARQIHWLARGAVAAALALGALQWLAPAPPAVVPPPAAPPAPVAPVPASASAPQGESAGPPERVIYRWRDLQGEVHISSEGPPPGAAAEAIRFQPAPSSPPATAGAPVAAPPLDLLASPLSVYSPDGLRQLGNRLAETRRLLQEREATIEALRRESGP